MKTYWESLLVCPCCGATVLRRAVSAPRETAPVNGEMHNGPWKCGDCRQAEREG